MTDPLSNEPWLRAGVFVLAIAALGLIEVLAPRRRRRNLRQVWPNIGLFITATVVVRLVSITSVTGIAAIATAKGWGFFHWIGAPHWIEFLISVVALDLSMYLQHRLMHWTPWLWRLHAVHHSDTEFDVTTGVRFHVGEIVVSFAWKLAFVLALGASVWAVLVFEVLLSTASVFTHANLRLPSAVDGALRGLVVTPDMHRVHHSVDTDEHNRNFGFLFIWWDRWFGSYREQPRRPHEAMPIGLHGYDRPESQTLWSLLKQPFAVVEGEK